MDWQEAKFIGTSVVCVLSCKLVHRAAVQVLSGALIPDTVARQGKVMSLLLIPVRSKFVIV